MRDAYEILFGTPERTRKLGRVNVGRGIILNLVLRTEGERVWIGLTWLRIELAIVSYKCDIEPSGFIKGEEFLE
jgi:hypothetical protein